MRRGWFRTATREPSGLHTGENPFSLILDGVRAQRFGEQLDRHLAFERGIGGGPDDAHATLAEFVE